jgi:uroporphyrin-III C-methyltransferase
MPHPDDFPAGSVWLVGAGPGDPELLTRKAARLIGAADIVFHDALVGPAILDLIPPGAVRVSVGKRSGRHSVPQDQTNALIVAAAHGGARVVRLKGGDPSVFGRSAEEVAALGAGGVPVRICPGITTASAAAASAGVSLTLRGQSRRLTFVTAHARAGDTLALDWPALAASETTLAIYMGRAAAPTIMAELIAAGADPATPVLVAVDVSLPTERLIHGRLDALAFLVRTVTDEAPTLMLIGAAAGRSGSDALLPSQATAPIRGRLALAR